MKNLWLMLLTVLSLFAACSDDDEKDIPTCPVTVSEMAKNAIIGAEYTIKGDGFAQTAKFSFQNEAGTTYLEDVQIETAQVIFTIPTTMTAGKYDLMLEQNGSWKLGEVTLNVKELPVTDLKLPSSAELGGEIIIEGNGYTDDMELFLLSAEGKKVALEVALTENGIKTVIPQDVAVGEYSLLLVQGNFEWNLGSVNVTKPLVKRIKSFTFDMGMGAEMLQVWTLGYDEENRLTTIDATWMGEPYLSYQFAYSENKIEVVSDGYYFDLKNGRIVYSSAAGNDWTYNDDFLVSDGEHMISYENSNWTYCDFYQLTYDDPALLSKPKTIDMSAYIFKFLLMALGDDDYIDMFLPHMLGICGTTSVNLPSGFVDLGSETGDVVNFEYSFDEQNYVQEVKALVEMMGSTLSLQFEYEVVE